jgi:hypothetical protein
MKPDHIPIMSYVFIGVTSLVLTYATIMDTTNEIILPPTNEPESYIGSMIPSVSLPEVAIPSYSDTIDKIKLLNPFATAVDGNPVASQSQIPVAVPVVDPSAPPPVTGGNRQTKHKKRKQKKSKHTRRTDK